MRSLAQFAMITLAAWAAFWYLNVLAALAFSIVVVPLLTSTIAWYVIFTLPHEVMDRYHETAMLAAQQHSAPLTPIERDARLR